MHIQHAAEDDDQPDDDQLRHWVDATTDLLPHDCELTIRIVDIQEITLLNREYRHQDKATNVLSFPFERPMGIPEDAFPALLGDVVICASVVNREASGNTHAHWAHMVIHGVLHLLGHDHETEADAAVMEALETGLLAGLGFADPYSAQPAIGTQNV